MDRMIKLSDIIGFIDLTKDLETNSLMQVGIDGENCWDDCTEISAASPLLMAYYDWDITAMGIELSNEEDPNPIFRVLIRRPDQEAET